jgi:hypothetical protein
MSTDRLGFGRIGELRRASDQFMALVKLVDSIAEQAWARGSGSPGSLHWFGSEISVIGESLVARIFRD